MKRIAYILISMLLIVSILASCGEKTTETKKESSTNRTAGTSTTQTENAKSTAISSSSSLANKGQAMTERTLSQEELENSMVLYKSKWRRLPDTLTPKYFSDTVNIRVDKKKFKKYEDQPNYTVYDYKDGLMVAYYEYIETKDEDYYERNIKVPETIGGKPVIGISGYYNKHESWELEGAFGDAYVRSLYLPKTIKYIEGFDTNIGNVYISKDNPYYWSKDGAIYTKDKKTLLFVSMLLRSKSDGGTGKFVIPNGVENLSKNAFPYDRYNKFVGAVIPASVKKIECDYLPLDSVSKENKYYSEYNGYLYNKDKTVLLKATPHYWEAKIQAKLAKTVKKIDINAFYLDDSEISLEVGADFEKQNYCFSDWGKYGLRKIIVPKENKNYYTDGKMLLSKDKKVLYFLGELSKKEFDFTIPNSVEKIAFPLNKLRTVSHSSYDKVTLTIGRNVKKIYYNNDINHYIKKIKGYKGTAAEEFAKWFEIDFIALD